MTPELLWNCELGVQPRLVSTWAPWASEWGIDWYGWVVVEGDHYVSMSLCLYVCMSVCLYLSIYLCTYVRRHAWMYVNIYMWYPLISVVTHDALVKFKEAAFLTPTGAAAASPSSWRLIPSPDEVMWIRTDRTPSCCNFNWGNMGKRGKVINVLKQWSNVINTIHICNMYIYIIQIQCECNMNKI
jgi:hypothetical protein